MALQQNDRPVTLAAETLVHTFARPQQLSPRGFVSGQTLSTGFRDLHEYEAAGELRVRLEQTLDGQKLLIDSLRVVEAIDPDTDCT